MRLIAKIKSLLGLDAKSKAVTLRKCVKCDAPLEPPLDAIINGEHCCQCGAVYSVHSGCADVSQLKRQDGEVKALLANCHVKIPFATKSQN